MNRHARRFAESMIKKRLKKLPKKESTDMPKERGLHIAVNEEDELEIETSPEWDKPLEVIVVLQTAQGKIQQWWAEQTQVRAPFIVPGRRN